MGYGTGESEGRKWGEAEDSVQWFFGMDAASHVLRGVQSRVERALLQLLSNLRNLAKTLVMFREMNKTVWFFHLEIGNIGGAHDKLIDGNGICEIEIT